MKVLIIGPPPAIGGTEIHLSRIVPRLMNHIAVERASPQTIGLIGLVDKIKRFKPNIIHYFLPRPYVLGSIATSIARSSAKRIMSRRSLRDCYHYHWLEQRFHSRTDAFVANSHAVYKELAKDTGREPWLIHNGVDIPNILLTPTQTFTITCLGSKRPYKGHQDLEAALELIKDKLPKPWRYLPITNSRNPTYWLRQTDLFVLPSHTEGFSNALLEAMALGLPCIATTVGGNMDAIVHNQSGVLVAPRHPADLSLAILDLAYSVHLRRTLGAAARLRVRAHFTLDQCIDKYLHLYDKVLNG